MQHMMTRRLLTLGAAAALSFTLGACGGDDDGGGGGGGDLNFSESDSAQLGSLSAAQRTSMCQELERYAAAQISEEEQVRYTCTFAGIFAASFSTPQSDAEARMTCSAARDMCIASPDEDDPDDMDTCELEDIDSQSCTATVGELEACAKAQIIAFKEQIQEVSCDTLTIEDDGNNDDDGSDPGATGRPAECQPVEQKCPSFFEDDTTPPPTDPPPAE